MHCCGLNLLIFSISTRSNGDSICFRNRIINTQKAKREKDILFLVKVWEREPFMQLLSMATLCMDLGMTKDGFSLVKSVRQLKTAGGSSWKRSWERKKGMNGLSAMVIVMRLSMAVLTKPGELKDLMVAKFFRASQMSSMCFWLITQSLLLTLSAQMGMKLIEMDHLFIMPISFFFGQLGLSLESYLDNFTLPLHSRCPTCDIHLLHVFTFMLPLLAFNLSNNFNSQFLDPLLHVTHQGLQISYHLQGVIYLDNQHFTECLITKSGLVWYYDRIFTRCSLVYNSNNVTSIVAEKAVLAFYRHKSPTF